MKKRKLVLIIFAFFSFCSGVGAKTVSCENLYSGTRLHKKVGTQTVYCAMAQKDIACTKGNQDKSYVTDTDWKSLTCTYKNDPKTVDCSVMVGYVIAKAKHYGSALSHDDKYIFIQRAVQTYLKKYGPNADYKNSNYSYASQKGARKSGNKIIKKSINQVIDSAHKAYRDKNCSIPSSKAPNINISFNVDGNDNGMYYSPSKNAYLSYKVVVKVNRAPSGAKLEISTNSKDVKLCTEYNDLSNCDNVIDVDSDKSEFYVLSKNSNIDPKLTASVVTETENASCSYKTYDTTMYKSTRNPRFQKLVSVKSHKKNQKRVTPSYSEEKTFDLRIVPVKITGCAQDYPGYETRPSSSRFVKCLNNNTGSVGNPNVATYKTCKSLTNEKVEFWYKDGNSCVKGSASTYRNVGFGGKFIFDGIKGDTSPKIIKGQGFYLTENNLYNVTISWKNGMIYNGNNVYFSLPTNGNVHHNTRVYNNSGCNGNSQSFDEYASQAKSTMSYDLDVGKLEDNVFKTYVNNANSLSKVKSKIEIISSAKDFKNIYEGVANARTLTYKFTTPNAYFNLKTGDVEYTTANNSAGYPSTSYRAAGKRYYTLLKYNKTTYPFNIKSSNIIEGTGITWSLDGACSPEIGNGDDDGCPELYKNVDNNKYSINASYRSISVSNPFPKNKIAKNWVEVSRKNDYMNRIKNTFSKKAYYSVTFKKSEIDKITNENNKKRNYKSFDGITSDGISEMIRKNSEFKVNNANSYCKLGYFSTNCDQFER